MKKLILWTALLLTGLMSACKDSDSLNPVFISNAAFELATDGWVADFSGYSTDSDSVALQRTALRSRLPFGLDTSQYAFLVQAAPNSNDQLFMYLKKVVTGFNPNVVYNISFEVTVGTAYPSGAAGPGGVSGSNMFLKAGASQTEPNKVLRNTIYEFNLDKGIPSQEGPAAIILGDATNGSGNSAYRLSTKTGSKSISVRPNANGEIWLFVGMDSGAVGLNTVFYDRIKVFLVAQQ